MVTVMVWKWRRGECGLQSILSRAFTCFSFVVDNERKEFMWDRGVYGRTMSYDKVVVGHGEVSLYIEEDKEDGNNS